MIAEGPGHVFLHSYMPSVMQTHAYARKGRKSNNLHRKEETFNPVTVHKGSLVQNEKKKTGHFRATRVEPVGLYALSLRSLGRP